NFVYPDPAEAGGRRESFVSAASTRDLLRGAKRWSGPPRGPLFGLAPDGVCHASLLALGAVGSYSTFSPLPRPEERGGIFSVALSVGTPRGVTSRVYPESA